jgi:hypothetical protein
MQKPSITWDITGYFLLTELEYYCEKKKKIIAALLATGNNPRENSILELSIRQTKE